MSINHFEGNIMKNAYATTAVLLAAALSAGSSFAAYSAPQHRLNSMETSSHFAKSAPSVLSRDAVKADLQAAQKAGLAPVRGDSEMVRDSSAPSTLSRSVVQAEAARAVRNNTVGFVDYRG
jgi:hypothetical protein